MGGQQARRGKHLYLCLAGLIALGGCVRGGLAPGDRLGLQQWPRLQSARSHVERGDFDAAARDYQRVLSSAEKSRSGDAALFDLGLLYCHYANPARDYRKSLLLFTRLLNEYPASPLAEETKIWIGLLETLERTKQVDIELDEKKKTFGR